MSLSLSMLLMSLMWTREQEEPTLLMLDVKGKSWNEKVVFNIWLNFLLFVDKKRQNIWWILKIVWMVFATETVLAILCQSLDHLNVLPISQPDPPTAYGWWWFHCCWWCFNDGSFKLIKINPLAEHRPSECSSQRPTTSHRLSGSCSDQENEWEAQEKEAGG